MNYSFMYQGADGLKVKPVPEEFTSIQFTDNVSPCLVTYEREYKNDILKFLIWPKANVGEEYILNIPTTAVINKYNVDLQ